MKAINLLRAGLLCTLLLDSLPELCAESPATEAYTWGVRARLKEMDGDIDGAIADYDKAIAVYPQDAQPFNARGALKKAKGDLAGAIADYDKAIALNPDSDIYIIYGNRGGARQENGDLDGAIADYNQVIALKPDYAIIYNNRGIARQNKGDLDGAIADLAKAAALEPEEANYRVNLATARQENGDLDGAIADYGMIVGLEPELPVHYFNRGNFKQIKGDFDGAIMDYNKVIELGPKSWGGYLQRGIARQAMGDLEGAITDYDKATTVTQDEVASAWVYRETVLRQLHRSTPFADLAKTVAKWKDGRSKSAGLYLIEALAEADYLARAGQGDAKVVPLNQCVAYYFVGRSRLLAGDLAAARDFFERSVATKRTDASEFVLARAELGRLAKQP